MHVSVSKPIYGHMMVQRKLSSKHSSPLFTHNKSHKAVQSIFQMNLKLTRDFQNNKREGSHKKRKIRTQTMKKQKKCRSISLEIN